jgi:gliding motility-associated-like protein
VNINCGDTNGGRIEIQSVNGGVSPYTGIWSTGDTTQISGDTIVNYKNLADGVYFVTITDRNGCASYDTTIIEPPPPLDVTIQTVSDYQGYPVSCFDSSDASVRVNLGNGEPPYHYRWYLDGVFYDTLDQDLLSDIGAGTYSVLVTDSFLCEGRDTVSITQPDSISLSLFVVQPLCAGGSDGHVSANATGGVPNYLYEWSDGQTGKFANGMVSGNYQVTVYDRNGCYLDSSFYMSEPEQLSMSYTSQRPSCPVKPDGSIDVSVRGGTSPYQYTWTNSMGEHYYSYSIEFLKEDIYYVTVADGHDCTLKDTIRLNAIDEICLHIPTAFSPNNDGVNDVWYIENVELYPELSIDIYDRWGAKVYEVEDGYSNDWEGNYNGLPLPVDSYHYIVDPKNGKKPFLGQVTIIR